MIEFQNAAIGYREDPEPVMENLNLCIERGDEVAVIGPNGAGKSTLFKTIVGLVPPLRGKMFLHGQDGHGHKGCVSYIPQKEAIDWNYPVTVYDVVMMGRYGHIPLFGKPGTEDERLVREAMERMEIMPLAERKIRDCSGGQQQRVFLARSLAQQPHIILMDEPFNGVDVPTEQIIIENLARFREQQVTILVATHDFDIVAKHFRKVLLLNHDVIAFGSTSEVLSSENLRKAYGGKAVYL